MTDLDEFFANARRPVSSGCPLCGERNEVMVQVRIERVNVERRSAARTRSRCFCALHGIALWRELGKLVRGDEGG
jgi:hypothetical protein